MKTSELTGPALDWAVAKCEDIRVAVWPDSAVALENVQFFDIMEGDHCEFSTNWAQGGPIIEREWICADRLLNGLWLAVKRNNEGDSMLFGMSGPTPLIAAMRCYVASKLGDEVDVPGELT